MMVEYTKVRFPNPFQKEMEESWCVPERYDPEEIEKSFRPLSAFVSKAVKLYESGDYLSALGICFDLIDRLAVLHEENSELFYAIGGNQFFPDLLVDSNYHVISKIYKDKSLSQEVRDEIDARINHYHSFCNFPIDYCIGGKFNPIKVIRCFGGFASELFYSEVLGVPASQVEEEETDKIPKEWMKLRKDLARKVLDIKDCTVLSDEELALLSEIHVGMFFMYDS